jgi:hypothetical protein
MCQETSLLLNAYTIVLIIPPNGIAAVAVVVFTSSKGDGTMGNCTRSVETIYKIASSTSEFTSVVPEIRMILNICVPVVEEMLFSSVNGTAIGKEIA